MDADLIDFSIIESSKENIQSIPSGRSAKTLAAVLSPKCTPSQNTQDAARQDFERQIASSADHDDPLDIYDRYVRWTIETYPSAQATASSQLLPLLERATKAFLTTNHYKNDPRYLKLWLNYIGLFSETPRETYAFLARHGIGDSLALYYEEFAAWLEGAGRWNQAEEIYKMGLEKEARPTERLMRKFGEFEQRLQNRPNDAQEPNSPALPMIRPALAAKIDPFASLAPEPTDPQAGSQTVPSKTLKRNKLQIFSDDGEESRPASGDGAAGWQGIGTLAERRKENNIAPTPWNGEKLGSTVKSNLGMGKMMVFKDQSLPNHSIKQIVQEHPFHGQQTMNSRTGRLECVFVKLEAVYPNPADPNEEYCFEELRAAKRGWSQRDWRSEKSNSRSANTSSTLTESTKKIAITPLVVAGDDERVLVQRLEETLVLQDENAGLENARKGKDDVAKKMRREERANRTRKIKVREVRGETQTIQTNLDSPQSRKLKRKKSDQPTMTLCTKAATDEIYELFNQPLKTAAELEDEQQSDSDSSDDDDDYTSAGESTGTGRLSGPASEYGEDTQADLTEAKSIEAVDDNGGGDTTWSEFTTSKHMPKRDNAGEATETSQTSMTRAENEAENEGEGEEREDDEISSELGDQNEEELVTPTSPTAPVYKSETRYIPVPPADLQAPTRPFRDSAQTAWNKLPFMTPIVEKTESSMGINTGHQDKDYFTAKTPCPKAGVKTPAMPEVGEPWSSPFEEATKEVEEVVERICQPILKKLEKKPISVAQTSSRPSKELPAARTGPIIRDAQCNPMDDHIHSTILSEMQPPLSSFSGYHDHQDVVYNRKTEIRKFCRTVASVKKGEKTVTNIQLPPILSFDGAERKYQVKKELGAGAFAPVYLVEEAVDEGAEREAEVPAVMGKGVFGVQRRKLEALKMEDPPSAWEFSIIKTVHRRLGVSRAADSIIQAYEMHLFRDECFLIEEFRDQGTLLDLVNLAGETGGGSGMDETLAMFFAVELLRTAEALHSKGIIHGDLKADNVLLRLESDDLQTPYQRDGTSGWSGKGVSLIDFGRGIDMRAFRPDVQFIADWETSATDCAEMRELRPWTYHADYHGIAAIVHTMLFGKYIETVAERGGTLGAGAAKVYRLKEGLKRWWQQELWAELFALLLNPGRHVEAEDGGKLPILEGMRATREKLEAWLEANGDKGVGLRATLRKTEALVASKRRP